MFAIVVGAGLKAQNDLAAKTAWHTRNLHYVKDLPDLAKYLKPRAAKSAESKVATVRAAIAQIAKRKKGEG